MPTQELISNYVTEHKSTHTCVHAYTQRQNVKNKYIVQLKQELSILWAKRTEAYIRARELKASLWRTATSKIHFQRLATADLY